MDVYFRDCPWIVPGSGIESVSGAQREQAIAEGEQRLSSGTDVCADELVGAGKSSSSDKVIEDHRVEKV